MKAFDESVFTKDDIFKTKVISRIYTELSDAEVLLCKLSQIGDVIMYFTYVSPEDSCIYDKLAEKNGINIIPNIVLATLILIPFILTYPGTIRIVCVVIALVVVVLVFAVHMTCVF